MSSPGMVKRFAPQDWADSPVVGDGQIKIASTGLGLGDKQDAGKFASPEVLHWLSRLETHPDCIYVHKIAMSGSDRYGPNRWGDGFREEVLKRDAPTFEQYAKAYRHHKSGKAPYYGKPKIARLREPMGVVELVTEYYGTDDVAEKNGGKIADLEMRMLSKTGSIPVSMGSHVPGDSCAVCSNWAPTRKDYCEAKTAGGKCELFGCKYGMLKVADDGRQQYVDNPLNCFYDISTVLEGADPIADGLLLPIGSLAEKMLQSKVAEFTAEQVPTDVTQLSHERRVLLHLAYYWADCESKLAANFEPDDVLDLGLQAPIDYGDLSCLHARADGIRDSAIKSLAGKFVCPDFCAYAKAAGYTDSQVEYARQFVPEAYTRLIRSQVLLSIIPETTREKYGAKYFVESKLACTNREIGRAAVLRRSLEQSVLDRKVLTVKRASLTGSMPKIVADYAGFKLAWAAGVPLNDSWILQVLPRREFAQLKLENF